MHNHKVIVLNIDSYGLNAVRSPGRLGIETYSLDYKNDAGFYSKYCKKKLLFENPLINSDKCLEQ